MERRMRTRLSPRWTSSSAMPVSVARLINSRISSTVMATAKLSRNRSLTLTARLPSSHERHLGGHDGHELDIGVQRQLRHIEHGIGDVAHIHAGFRQDIASGLADAARHAGG